MDRKELVEKMIDVWFESANCNEVRMDKVLSVAIEELLGYKYATREEGRAVELHNSGISMDCVLAQVFENRRLKFERVKTVEERVKVERYLQLPDRWIVLLDGANPTSTFFGSEKDAEIYRLGLIQQLKEKK